MDIQPLTCLRPVAERAAAFASAPYDVFGEQESRDLVAGNPGSFLAIDRPETSFAEGQDPTDDALGARARELLRERQLDGTLVRDEKPCYYVYETSWGSRRLRGLVAAVSVDEYLDGTISHQDLAPEKVRDWERHITRIRAQASPVYITYRGSEAIDAILAMMCMGEALYDFVAADGVRHRVWRVAREVGIEALTVAFSTVEHAYIADGHHCAAAEAAICGQRRAEGRVDDPAEYLLAALFPQALEETMAVDGSGISETPKPARPYPKPLSGLILRRIW